jgi:hypothetical protein
MIPFKTSPEQLINLEFIFNKISNLEIDKKFLLKAYNLAKFDQGVYDLMEMMSEHQQEKEELQEDIVFIKKSVAEYEQFINLNNIKELENYFAN